MSLKVTFKNYTEIVMYLKEFELTKRKEMSETRT